MHDNRRPRYLVFFYSNSTSFVASIVVIVLLLRQWRWNKKDWSLKVMNTVILLDLLALLGAYAAGSSRDWKTSMYVVALIAAVLAYVAIHIMLALSCSHQHETLIGQGDAPQSHEQTNGGIRHSYLQCNHFDYYQCAMLCSCNSSDCESSTVYTSQNSRQLFFLYIYFSPCSTS
jgi:hypothetical protein